MLPSLPKGLTKANAHRRARKRCSGRKQQSRDDSEDGETLNRFEPEGSGKQPAEGGSRDQCFSAIHGMVCQQQPKCIVFRNFRKEANWQGREKKDPPVSRASAQQCAKQNRTWKPEW